MLSERFVQLHYIIIYDTCIINLITIRLVTKSIDEIILYALNTRY